MDAREAIKLNLSLSEFISLGYLQDLGEDELFHRPAAGANHIIWQVGHLVTEEYDMLDTLFPGSMPHLPAGFAARYGKDKASIDERNSFDTLDVLLATYREVRAKTLELLDAQRDDDLDRRTPDRMQSYAPTIGAAFSMLGTHWVMHAGQWAVIRRQCGRPPLY